MNKLILVFLAAACCYAGYLDHPVMYPDGQGVQPGLPEIGAPVIALTDVEYDLWANDNYGNARPDDGKEDFDLNDAHARATFEYVSPGLIALTLQYLDTNSAHDNDIRIATGWPAVWLEPGQSETAELYGVHAGDEVKIAMLDTNTGYTYLTGDGSDSPDKLAHWFVKAEDKASTVPEPGTAVCGLIGTVLVALSGKFRRKGGDNKS